MPSRRVRLVLLFLLLGSSVALLLRPQENEVVIESRWTVEEAPTNAGRCPPPAPEQAQWHIAVAGDFALFERSTLHFLGPTCGGACTHRVEVEVAPRWVDRPGWFTGYGHLDIPITIRRRVGECHDVTRLRLDIRVDQGVRGNERMSMYHAGRIVGGGIRSLHAQGTARSEN